MYGNDLWSVHRSMKADPTDYGHQHIPDLENIDGTHTTTSEEKAERLANTFVLAA